MDKEDVTHIVGYYLATKKKEILPFAATWMDLEGIMLSFGGANESEKITTVYHLYVESNNKLANITKKKSRLRYRKQTRGYQWLWGGAIWE